MRAIYTIGYEGADIDRLIEALLRDGVELIADVRAVAISRKKGFSKSALKANLAGVGVQYVHFGELGDPKAGRLAARAGLLKEFRGIYSSHLRQPSARAALDRLAEVARRNLTCLLCFERDSRGCHRSIVAARLARRGFTKFDLYPGPTTQHDHLAAKLPRLRSRKSTAATEQDAR